MCGCARHQQVSATAGGGVSAAIGAAAPQKCADKLVRIRVMGCYREAECVCGGIRGDGFADAELYPLSRTSLGQLRKIAIQNSFDPAFSRSRAQR